MKSGLRKLSNLTVKCVLQFYVYILYSSCYQWWVYTVTHHSSGGWPWSWVALCLSTLSTSLGKPTYIHVYCYIVYLGVTNIIHTLTHAIYWCFFLQDKLLFEPYALRKNVAYIVVVPSTGLPTSTSNISKALKKYFRDLSITFKVSHQTYCCELSSQWFDRSQLCDAELSARPTCSSREGHWCGWHCTGIWWPFCYHKWHWWCQHLHATWWAGYDGVD